MLVPQQDYCPLYFLSFCMINYYLHTLLLLTTYDLLGALALPEQDGFGRQGGRPGEMAVGATPQVLLPLALTLTPSPTLPLPYPQAQPHPYPYPHQVGAARQLLVRQNQGHRDADVRGRRADAPQCTHGAHVGHATGRGPHRAGCTPPEGAAAERDERAITWPDVPDQFGHG